MILSVTLNPSVDRAIHVEQLKLYDTNRVLRTETDAGGKGINLSRVADELGAKTLATGFVGGGPGGFVKSVLDREGVPYDFVEVDGETRINFSVEDAGEDPPTTFNSSGPEIAPEEWAELQAKCRRLARRGGWACMGGSVPPGLEKSAHRILIELFRELGCRTLLDADGEALRHGIEAGPNLVKPNEKEAERLLGKPAGTDEEALAAAKEIRERGVSIVILSRGERGAILACDEGIWRGTSPEIEPKSTIGSGDSMLGGFLWALEDGRSVEEAFRWGLAAGAATATTDSTEIARKPKVEELFPRAFAERID
jgi:1-phosphofructokinase family hexose kinase